jgi:hypothetical protein
LNPHPKITLVPLVSGASAAYELVVAGSARLTELVMVENGKCKADAADEIAYAMEFFRRGGGAHRSTRPPQPATHQSVMEDPENAAAVSQAIHDFVVSVRSAAPLASP